MTTGFLVFTSFLLAAGQCQLLVWDGRSVVYFVAAGVAENAYVFLVLVALSLGEVSVVTPLAGTAPLFVLARSFVFLKGVERLHWRIAVGSVLIVLGVFLLTVKAP